jgi:metal-sulfur cluster biosynthetic enzyme
MENSENNSTKLSWQAEKTHPDIVDQLKKSLREVVDPEIGLSIIELGLIRDVRIEDDLVQITMILTTPYCPYGPTMLEMTREKAENALGIPTKINISLEMWDFSMMEEGIDGNWGLYT